jgi:hypothetical protein
MGSHPASEGYKYRGLVLRDGGWAWGELYPVKKKIVEKPPRNTAGFCGGGQGPSWAVEPRKEEKEEWSYEAHTATNITFLVTF